MDSKSLSHTKWKCQYHIVFILKCRKKQIYGWLKEDIRDLIKTLCAYKGVEIVEGAVCPDYVHMCVCIPPKLSVPHKKDRIISVFLRLFQKIGMQ